MEPLRRFVRFCLGIQALGLLGSVPLMIGVLKGIRESGEEMSRLASVVAYGIVLLIPLAGLIPAIAWWTLRKGKPSARAWAIAASVLNLLAFLAGSRTLSRIAFIGSVLPVFFTAGVGVLGVIAFWRPASVSAAPEPPVIRVAGDGTSKIKDYTAPIVSVAILWIFLELWNRWSTAHGLQGPDIITGVLLLQIAIVVNTFCHEMGHFVAGWASGMILRRFQVGPAMWSIQNGKWVFQMRWNHFYGGSVGMVSPTLDDLRGREAFMIAGGPVASLLVGSVGMLATLSAPGHFWQPYWTFLSMMTAMGWAAFVTNLIPIKSAANYSDGAQLFQLFSGGEWAQFHLAFGMVASSLVTSIRPRDFDVALIHRAAALVTQGERALLLRLYACKHYLDDGKVPEGLAAMSEAEGLYDQSRFERPEDIYNEFIFLNAFYKRDLAAAEVWSRRLEALTKPDLDADYWCAQTALLWLRGEREKARETWERGNAMAQKLPPVGAYDSTRLCFKQLREALNEPYHEAVFLPNHQTTPIVAVV